MTTNEDLSIIVSYHDVNKLNINKIKDYCRRFTNKVYMINNEKYCSDKLMNLKKKYPFVGVQFDEFNAQSYYCDKMTDKQTEYVYHIHYRRYIDTNKREIENNINEKTIFCPINEEYEHITMYDFFEHHVVKHDKKSLLNLKDVLSKVFDISITGVDNILKKEFNSREMYIIHQSLQKRLVETGYKFIDTYCKYMPQKHLKQKRNIGYSLEGFVSFFFSVLEEFEGYRLIKNKYKLF